MDVTISNGKDTLTVTVKKKDWRLVSHCPDRICLQKEGNALCLVLEDF
jgi:hypothetical protein